ncbi:MAG: serine/threonine protein kinase [Chitinivibrionales bacterium]|nr:serine/threonine protein kinase [Chitinivibrionales bacterium]
MDINAASYIGRDVGNVTLLKEIGRGGNGIVFVAFQKSLKRQVAVKILLRTASASEDVLANFLNEAEIVASLSHPYIIPIFDMGAEADCYYQIMQLVNGTDLNTMIQRTANHPVAAKRLLPIEYTLNTMENILEGLEYAHSHGVVHQDIKPSNILVEESTKRPLIADFGIAKAVELGFAYADSNVITGSPLYISPEQASTRKTDHRTDIYAVGVMFFKMLAGKLPRREEKPEQIIIRKIQAPETFFIQKPSEVSPLIDERLEQIILKAIEPRVEKRYQDCTSLRKDIQAYKESYKRHPIY